MSSHRITHAVPFSEVCNWESPLTSSWVEPRKAPEPKGLARRADLDQVIEEEIIPRLLLLHKNSATDVSALIPLPSSIDAAFVERFAKLTQSLKSEELAAIVVGLVQSGVTARELLLDLFAPAARLLGESWVTDEIDFVAVTIGLSRIQQLVHDAVSTAPILVDPQMRLKALVVPAPGEQHSLGAVIAGHLFRTAGWIVDGGLALSLSELKDMMRQDDYAVIGFSLASETHVSAVAEIINYARKLKPKKDLAVIVGGNLAVCRPDLCSALGADFLTADVAAAVEFGNAFAAASGKSHSRPVLS